MNRQSSMSIEERVYRFQEAQQILADTIGLAVPVPHGEPMKLYDIWEKRLVEVTLLRGTEVKKEPGKGAQIFHFDKRDSDRVKKEICGACKHHGSMFKDGKWICKNPKSDLNGVETPFYAGCEEFEEGSN